MQKIALKQPFLGLIYASGHKGKSAVQLRIRRSVCEWVTYFLALLGRRFAHSTNMCEYFILQLGAVTNWVGHGRVCMSMCLAVCSNRIAWLFTVTSNILLSSAFFVKFAVHLAAKLARVLQRIFRVCECICACQAPWQHSNGTQFTAQLAVKFNNSYFLPSYTYVDVSSVCVCNCNCVCCCTSAYEKGVNFLNGLKIGQFYSLMNKTFLFCNNYKHTRANPQTVSPEGSHKYY